MKAKEENVSPDKVTKKLWEAPAILLEQSLVVRAQDPADPTDPALGRDPFLGPLNVSSSTAT